MLRRFRVLLPFLAALAGLFLLPSGGMARGYYQGGWDIYAPYEAAPREMRRKARPRQAIDRDFRPRMKAHAHAKAKSTARLRHATRVKSAKAVAASKARRAQRLAKQRQLQRRAAAYAYGPAEHMRRPARRVAALGDAHLERLTSIRPAGRVEARIDIRSQRMVVRVDGEVKHVWKVSTGRAGFATPRGSYGPQRMHVSYFSKKYYNSPMPYSIFFRGGYAVHGTNAINRLGGVASHGCVRLAVPHARALFQLVKAYGPGRSRIVIG